MITALAGGSFTRGQITSPLTVAAAPTALNQLLALNGFTTATDSVARRQALEFLAKETEGEGRACGAQARLES